LPKNVTSLIKRADKMAAFLEATQLAGFEDGEARRFFTVPRGLSEKALRRFSHLKPMPPTQAQEQFLNRFTKLLA